MYVDEQKRIQRITKGPRHVYLYKSVHESAIASVLARATLSSTATTQGRNTRRWEMVLATEYYEHRKGELDRGKDSGR